MLFNRARMVPDIAPELGAFSTARHINCSPSRSIFTAGSMNCFSVPSGPLTETSVSEE
jgi:hypothetical protein